MRIGLAGHRIWQIGHAAGMERRNTAREAGHRQIEASPEEMHRTRLADEAGAKLLHDAVDGHQDAPEAMGVFGVIGGVLLILAEAHRARNLVWHLIDADRQARSSSIAIHGRIEICHGTLLEVELPHPFVIDGHDQPVIDEVEVDRELRSPHGSARW